MNTTRITRSQSGGAHSSPPAPQPESLLSQQATDARQPKNADDAIQPKIKKPENDWRNLASRLELKITPPKQNEPKFFMSDVRMHCASQNPYEVEIRCKVIKKP